MELTPASGQDASPTFPSSSAFPVVDCHENRQRDPAVVLLSVACRATSRYWAGRKRFACWQGCCTTTLCMLGTGSGQGMNEILCINPIKRELPQKWLPSSHPFLLLMQKGAGMHVTNSTEFKWIYFKESFSSVCWWCSNHKKRLQLLVTEQGNLSRPNRIKIHFCQ